MAQRVAALLPNNFMTILLSESQGHLQSAMTIVLSKRRLSEKVSGAVEIRDVPCVVICTSRNQDLTVCESTSSLFLNDLNGIQAIHIDIDVLEYLLPSSSSSCDESHFAFCLPQSLSMSIFALQKLTPTKTMTFTFQSSTISEELDVIITVKGPFIGLEVA